MNGFKRRSHPGKGTKKQDCLRPLCGSQPTNPLLENRQLNNTTPQPRSLFRSEHVVTTDFPTPGNSHGGGARVTAVIAWGKRPVPFRTRKLRPTAPMVLHPGGCGRVGHRRNTIKRSRTPNHVGGPPAFNRLFDKRGCSTVSSRLPSRPISRRQPQNSVSCPARAMPLL